MLVNFTLNEVLYLDDGLTLLREDGDFDPRFSGSRLLAPMAVSAAPAELLLKLGSALLELLDTGNVSSIDLDEVELWLIREITQSGISYNGEQVGINLKKKIYTALHNLYVTEVLDEIDLPPVDSSVTEPSVNRDKLDALHYLEDESE